MASNAATEDFKLMFWKVDVYVNILPQLPPLQPVEVRRPASRLVNHTGNSGAHAVHWGRIFQMYAKKWRETTGNHIQEFHLFLVRVQEKEQRIMDLV
jgi:hypothetical protein